MVLWSDLKLYKNFYYNYITIASSVQHEIELNWPRHLKSYKIEVKLVHWQFFSNSLRVRQRGNFIKGTIEITYRAALGPKCTAYHRGRSMMLASSQEYRAWSVAARNLPNPRSNHCKLQDYQYGHIRWHQCAWVEWAFQRQV